MKNKTKLFMIPLAAMLLTGCGETDTSLPSGYTPVDLNNKEDVANFSNKLMNCVKKTQEKIETGTEIECSLKLNELSLTTAKKYSEEKAKKNKDSYFKLTNLNCNITAIAAENKGGLNDEKASLKIEDFGFDFELKVGETNVSLNARNIDVAAYIDGGNVYLDLSDNDLKTFTEGFIRNVACKGEEEDVIKDTIASVNLVLDKVYIPDYSNLLLGLLTKKDDEEAGYGELVSYSTDTTATADSGFENVIASYIEEIISDITTSNMKDIVTLADYKKSDAVGIGVNLNKEIDLRANENGQTDPNEYMKLKGDLAAALVFDKKGVFERFGLVANGNFESYINDEEDGITSTAKIVVNNLDLSIEADYGVRKVKMPDLSTYKELPSSALSFLMK